MKITIEGSKHYPRWDTVQLLARELTGDPLLQLTRIAPFGDDDHELDFRDHTDSLVRITLSISLEPKND